MRGRWVRSPCFLRDSREGRRMGAGVAELGFRVVAAAVRVGERIGGRRETLRVGGGFCCRRRAGGSGAGRLARFS